MKLSCGRVLFKFCVVVWVAIQTLVFGGINLARCLWTAFAWKANGWEEPGDPMSALGTFGNQAPVTASLLGDGIWPQFSGTFLLREIRIQKKNQIFV